MKRLLAFVFLLAAGSAFADSQTTNVSMTKPTPGQSFNTWGAKLNTNFDIIDSSAGWKYLPNVWTAQQTFVVAPQFQNFSSGSVPVIGSAGVMEEYPLALNYDPNIGLSIGTPMHSATLTVLGGIDSDSGTFSGSVDASRVDAVNLRMSSGAAAGYVMVSTGSDGEGRWQSSAPHAVTSDSSTWADTAGSCPSCVSGSGIYPATGTASFPFGLTGSTATMGSQDYSLSSADAWGDSITVGYNASNRSSTAYIPLIASSKGLTITNHGVSGEQVSDIPPLTYATSPLSHGNVIVWIGTNDARRNTAAGQPEIFYKTFSEQLAFLGIPASDTNKLDCNSVAITYSGAWTSGAWLGTTKTSTHNGNTATATLTGSTILVSSIIQPEVSAGSFTVTIDGVVYGPYQNRQSDFATTLNGQGYGTQLVQVSGLSNAEHTVVFTNTSVEGNYTYLRWMAGVSSGSHPSFPKIYVADLHYLSTAGYVSYGGSTGNTDNYNIQIASAVANLSGSGLNISLIHSTTTLNRTTDLDDGLHPTDTGHSKMAVAFENLITTTSATGGLMVNGTTVLNGDVTITGRITSPISVSGGGTGQDWSTAAIGKIPVFGGTGSMVLISTAPSGYFLKSNGEGAVPTFSSVSFWDPSAVSHVNAYKPGGTQACNSATYCNVTFSSEITDTLSEWNGSTFTATNAGTYQVNSWINFANNASPSAGSNYFILLYKNTTLMRQMEYVAVASNTTNSIVLPPTNVTCSVGDKLWIAFVQTTGASVDMNGTNGGYYTAISIDRIY